LETTISNTFKIDCAKNAADPWNLYDRLIEGIPPDLRVKQCVVGVHWTVIHSEGVGIAMTPPDGEKGLSIAGSIAGMSVREVALLSKSWKALEAALGVAAINSYYNAPTTLTRSWGDITKLQSSVSVFTEICSKVKGKKVTVVGHFPDLAQLQSICNVSILERKPQPGDLPDPACEYILPKQDYVFMTGVTFINKTMPRLLELSQGAQIVLVGPSVPLSPVFMKYGVSLLAGTVVLENTRVCAHVAEGGDRSIFRNGAMMLRLSGENFKGQEVK
jgi:uncharacterized protein (DUF4213/DUF364 family)